MRLFPKKIKDLNYSWRIRTTETFVCTSGTTVRINFMSCWQIPSNTSVSPDRRRYRNGVSVKRACESPDFQDVLLILHQSGRFVAFLGYFATLASLPRVCFLPNEVPAKATDTDTWQPPAELLSHHGQRMELIMTSTSSNLSLLASFHVRETRDAALVYP